MNSGFCFHPVEGQQQMECIRQDGGQNGSNCNLQDCSEVSSNLTRVERDLVQFPGHDHAGKNIMHSVRLEYAVVKCQFY